MDQTSRRRAERGGDIGGLGESAAEGVGERRGGEEVADGGHPGRQVAQGQEEAAQQEQAQEQAIRARQRGFRPQGRRP